MKKWTVVFAVFIITAVFVAAIRGGDPAAAPVYIPASEQQSGDPRYLLS